jgi:MscS family membrane protein
VTIPNAQFSTLALENLSRRDRIPVRATVTLPQGSDGGRVRHMLSALRTMLAEQPKVHRDSIRVRFMSMGPQALEIEFVAFVMTSSWDEFVEVREQILLQALDVVSESGAAIR